MYQRFLKVKAVAKKCKKLSRFAGYKARRCIKTGVVASAVYSAPVYGLSKAQLATVRRAEADSGLRSLPGRSLDVALGVIGDDPTGGIGASHVVRWA